MILKFTLDETYKHINEKHFKKCGNILEIKDKTHVVVFLFQESVRIFRSNLAFILDV